MSQNIKSNNKKFATENYLILFSLLLYPFEFFSHTLFLLPIVVLIITSIWRISLNRKWAGNYYKLGFLFLCLALTIISALAVEATSQNPNYLLVLKILINLPLVTLIYWSGLKLNTELFLSGIQKFIVFSIFFLVFLYVKNDTSLIQIFLLLSTDESIASSQLYGFAQPLEGIFLTKNISAMFYVSLFGLYLFCIANSNKNIKTTTIIAFFTCIALFFSRQAILSFIAVLSLFLILKPGIFRYLAWILSPVFIAFIFSKFFDFNSRADGASERILLWQYFFDNFNNFGFLGVGLNTLNEMLYSNIGIDNFHMFFMNQIGAYGLTHFIFFSAFCVIAFSRSINHKQSFILILSYYLNVLFQTYGYEFGNVFLFIFLLNSAFNKNVNHENIECQNNSMKNVWNVLPASFRHTTGVAI